MTVTKVLANSGGDYATWSSYITYLKTLGTLTDTQRGQVRDEFDGGDAQFTGAGCAPTATFRLFIESETMMSQSPFRYNDGGRVLFNASGEQLYVAWDYITVQNLASKKTAANFTTNLGAVATGNGLIVDLYNVLIEMNGSIGGRGLDDRASASSAARENVTVVLNGNSSEGIHCANNSKTYKNCAVHAFGSPGSGTGLMQSYATATWINCITEGFFTDVAASYGAGSKNCATSKASGSSNMASMTGAQFSVVGATEHVAWGTYGSHDLQVQSSSTKLKDVGAASGGTSTDFFGNAISGGTRDIGSHEYQAVGGGSNLLLKLQSHGAFL